jgi:hypothetical protein
MSDQTPFPFKELCGHLEARARAVNAARKKRKESALTKIVGQFYASLEGAETIHIAKSSHAAIHSYVRREKRIELETQLTDAFGEHDVSVRFKDKTTLGLTTEVKYARTAGKGDGAGEQNQVVQTYCYFIHDLLFSALSAIDARKNGRTTGALAFVEDKVMSKTREGSSNPWKSLADCGSCPGLDDHLEINPSKAKENSGRGNKEWPDFRDARTIKQRHVSLSMTGGTSAKLLGIFRRQELVLRIDFENWYKCIELNRRRRKLHILFLQPTKVELRSSEGAITEMDAILKWLP